MDPRRKVAGEIAQIVGGQLQGQIADQVKRRLAAWNDPRAKLDRRYRRSSRVLTFWLIVLAILAVVGTLALLGVVPVAVGVLVAGGFAGTGVLAVRTNTKMRGIDAARRQLAAAPVRGPLPARSSAARQPMERLEDAEDTLRELLRQLDSAALTSIPADSVAQARATGAEAASALRAVSHQLQAVERARDTAPPLDRGPLVEGVRRLRTQLDEGVDGYCGLVAAAGRVLAESTASNPRQVLGEATDHLAGLASALRDLSHWT
ncbi:phage shock envelope stress response protein PspM [Actinosynnema sp. CS-041913]|uniref:phage shock envelope stress response protein PspM n=1 Tax=Actinosynnema sp. CS-041913 TaxID=3239917 RepID=UPI003D911173